MKLTGIIYAIAAAITWGLVYTIDQKILTKVSPLTLLLINAVLTLIVTLPIILFDSSGIKAVFATGRTNLILMMLSVAFGVLASFFIFSAIKLLDAPTASIFEIAYPFFVVLFTALLFRTLPNIYFFLGAILIFLGSLVIIKLA